MLVVHATFPIDPDEHDDPVEMIQELAASSRTEDGVLEYRVAIDIDDEHRFRFFGEDEDKAAFEARAETGHFEEFAAVLPGMPAGEAEVRRFEVESATDVEL